MSFDKKLAIFFTLFMIFIGSSATYVVYHQYTVSNDWTTHNITGHLRTMQLYNQFPVTELYIVLDTGNYTRVNVNPFWAYAQLINFDTNNTISFTYQENTAGEVKMINIKTMEN